MFHFLQFLLSPQNPSPSHFPLFFTAGIISVYIVYYIVYSIVFSPRKKLFFFLSETITHIILDWRLLSFSSFTFWKDFSLFIQSHNDDMNRIYWLLPFSILPYWLSSFFAIENLTFIIVLIRCLFQPVSFPFSSFSFLPFLSLIHFIFSSSSFSSLSLSFFLSPFLCFIFC